MVPVQLISVFCFRLCIKQVFSCFILYYLLLYRYGNGDLYDGYFKDGQRQGHGIYRKGRKLSSASYIYVGEWLNDKRHGYGVMDDILKGTFNI